MQRTKIVAAASALVVAASAAGAALAVTAQGGTDGTQGAGLRASDYASEQLLSEGAGPAGLPDTTKALEAAATTKPHAWDYASEELLRQGAGPAGRR